MHFESNHILPEVMSCYLFVALGGRHDFLEDEEDRKATRRRSTPGSFSKVPKETEEEGKKTAAPSGTNQTPIDEKPADEPLAPNDQQQVASDAPSEPCGEQPALSAPSNEHLAPSDTPKEPASPGTCSSLLPPPPPSHQYLVSNNRLVLTHHQSLVMRHTLQVS